MNVAKAAEAAAVRVAVVAAAVAASAAVVIVATAAATAAATAVVAAIAGVPAGRTRAAGESLPSVATSTCLNEPRRLPSRIGRPARARAGLSGIPCYACD